MLAFYWALGKDIEKMQAEQKWGSSFFATLSMDLRTVLPGQEGFSETNIRYMKRFYVLYSQILPQLVEDLGDNEINPLFVDIICAVPWGHHRYIIDKCKGDSAKALFYVQKTIENNWSRACLLNWLDTDLYKRQGKAISEYELSKLYPTDFKGSLPSIEEIERQLK